MRRVGLLPAVLLASLLAGVGCTSYHHRLTEPTELACDIRAEDAVTRLFPMRYLWNTVEDRLVVRIFNDGESNVLLDGERSVLVDPAGQSRPLRSQTIASGSYARLVLPPYRSAEYAPGPTMSIGFGVSSVGAGHRAPRSVPAAMVIVHDHETRWDWPAGTTIRLQLHFTCGQETFDHAFVLERLEGK